MKLTDCGSEVKITGVSDFDLRKTFECGQCFRWYVDASGVYSGVAYDRAASLRQEGCDIYISGTVSDAETLWIDYFDLHRDYTKIRENFCISDFMYRATQFGTGIRILHQEPWETLCSFIISQNNHIPRIKKIIHNLCLEFGEPINFNKNIYYTFPPAKKLAGLSQSDLASLRTGYRADYIISAARDVASGLVDLYSLSALTPCEAKAELLKLKGVGNKVADCVLLYGLGMLDSFPVDVWMKRALDQHFATDFDLSCFAPYAGIAQQYIFYYMRNTKPLFKAP